MDKGRLAQLSEAITVYGEESVKLYHAIHLFGNKLTDALQLYLGEGAEVLGVPPQGEWQPEEYRDARFSSFKSGPIEVGAVEMGLAVRIPHIKDSGSLWMRILIDIEPVAGGLNVGIARERSVDGLGMAASQGDLERVCEEIFRFLLGVFTDPVRLATSVRAGRIGF